MIYGMKTVKDDKIITLIVASTVDKFFKDFITDDKLYSSNRQLKFMNFVNYDDNLKNLSMRFGVFYHADEDEQRKFIEHYEIELLEHYNEANDKFDEMLSYEKGQLSDELIEKMERIFNGDDPYDKKTDKEKAIQNIVNKNTNTSDESFKNSNKSESTSTTISIRNNSAHVKLGNGEVKNGLENPFAEFYDIDETIEEEITETNNDDEMSEENLSQFDYETLSESDKNKFYQIIKEDCFNSILLGNSRSSTRIYLKNKYKLKQEINELLLDKLFNDKENYKNEKTTNDIKDNTNDYSDEDLHIDDSVHKAFLIENLNENLMDAILDKNSDLSKFLDIMENTYGIHDGRGDLDSIDGLSYETYEIQKEKIDEFMNKWREYFISKGAICSDIIDHSSDKSDCDLLDHILNKLEKTKMKDKEYKLFNFCFT